MSETVTVVEAKNPNPWEHGITFYDMIFDRNGSRFACSWGTKGGEPQPGEEVTGEFSQKSDGSWKFSKGSKDKPGGGSTETRTSNNSKAASSKGDVDWDAKEARITRQAVLKIIAPMIHAKGDLTRDLKRIVEEIEQFVAEAPSRPLGEAPVDLAGARTEEPIPPKPSVNFHKSELPNQDLDDYRQLLSNAGLEPAAARDKAAEFMGVVLPEDRLNKAVSGLQDLDRQGTVLAQLKAETEQWIGGPLPQGDALDGDESIPF